MGKSTTNLDKIFVADFETINKEDDCRVWGWGLYSIGADATKIGKDINSFMTAVKRLPTGSKIYFHNLKFDGEFILYWLEQNGIKHTKEMKLEKNQYSTLINFMGAFYQIKLKIGNKNFTILDSLKVIPFPVSKIAKAFNLEQMKGEIDYNKERPKGYELTKEEKDYIKNDVEIVGKALIYFYNQSLDRMTTAGNSFKDFKEIISDRLFEKMFPILKNDSELRQAYKGGFTYVNKKYQGKTIENGLVFDVNSLYPAVMYSKPLPYGTPLYFDGKYEKDDIFNVYVQMLSCNFKLKDGYIPTIQLKNNMRFCPTEYLEYSNGVEVVLTLTSVDLELFLEHYEVYNIEWIGGYKFRSTDTLFKGYIDKWVRIKNESTLNNNEGMRTIAKLMLNSLYGKFGTNPKVISKIPVYDGELIHYKKCEEEEKEPIYIPVASFITAYAREITIRGAQENYDRFIYADTDSLHLKGFEIPENLEVDPVKLGAWKLEYKFKRGKFLRAKTYIEEKENGKIHIGCSGLPHKLHDFVTFEDFKDGMVVGGKLQHKRVKNGVVLKEIEFSLKL